MSQISGLADTLTCFICTNLVSNPIVLPCCGHLVCKNCASTWLRSNLTCPFCRATINNSDMLPVQWVTKVVKLISLLPRNNITCPIHKKPYTYLCKRCNVSLCADCLFDLLTLPESPHKGHEIIKLSEVLYDLQIKIKQRLLVLYNELDRYSDIVAQISGNGKLLNKQYRLARKVNYESQKKLENSFNQSTEAKIDEMKGHLKELKAAYTKIARSLAAMRGMSGQSARVALQGLKKVIDGDPDLLEPIQRVPPYKNPATPPLDVTTFVFRNFRVIETSVESQPVWLCRNQWRVKVEKNPEPPGYLTVFVYSMFLSSKVPVQFLLYIRIWNRDHTLVPIERNYITEFSQHDWWGWKKFCPYSLVEDGTVLRGNDLYLDLGIKAPSYRQYMMDTRSQTRRILQQCPQSSEDA